MASLKVILKHEQCGDIIHSFEFGDSYHDSSFEQIEGMEKLLVAMGYQIIEKITRLNDDEDY